MAQEKDARKYFSLCLSASLCNNKTIQRHNETQKSFFAFGWMCTKRQKIIGIRRYLFVFALVKCQEVCKKDIGKAYFDGRDTKKECLKR